MLQRRTALRAKLLFLALGIVGLANAAGLLITARAGVLAAIIGAVFYGLVFWRYMARIGQGERLELSVNRLVIINDKKLFGATRNAYDVQKIQGLRYCGFRKSLDHPLKGQSFDYLGFQTTQQVVDAVVDDGNISFGYEGREVHFGIGLPSWDAKELNALFIGVTSGMLFISELPEDIEEEDWNAGGA